MPGRKYQEASGGCQPAPFDWVDRLLGWIAPCRCILCRGPASGMDLCTDCMNDLPWLGCCCTGCAIPLPATDALLCGKCSGGSGPLDRAVAALAYEYPLDRVIAALKYRRRAMYARVLGELLAIRLIEARATSEFELPQLLVPVPMHWRRRFERQHNHAELICQRLGRELGIPVDSRSLRRLRNTQPQTGMTRAVRQRNLRNAFSVEGSFDGLSVGIVDDVITTGSTVRELAAVVRRAGAVEVQAYAVARVVL